MTDMNQADAALEAAISATKEALIREVAEFLSCSFADDDHDEPYTFPKPFNDALCDRLNEITITL